MKISGFQFYWLIAFGLIAGLAFPFSIEYLNINLPNNPILGLSTLLVFLIAIFALFIVCLEIWDRFGLGVAILAFIIFPLATIYWFIRIKGIKLQSNDT